MATWKKLLFTFVLVALAGGFIYLKVKQTYEEKLKLENQEQLEENVNSASITKYSGEGKVKKFANYEELRQFLETNAVSASSPSYMLKGMGEMAVSDMVATPTAAPSDGRNQAISEEGSAGSSADYSKTNVQVEGVDEADIIKTDGDHIYALSYNTLYIIKAYPGEKAEVLSKIEFKSRPQDLFINGQNLVVFGSDNEVYPMARGGMEIMPSFRRYNPYTFLKVFDLSDKKNPKEVRDLDFEGSYFSTRMIGDYVYLVVNNYNYYMSGEPVVPRLLDKGEEVPNKCDAGATKCYIPDVYYFDIPYDSYNFTTVAAINVKNNEEVPTGNIYLMSNSQNMYVSNSNLYITYTKYVSEYELEMEVAREIIFPRLSTIEQNKITKIEAADNFILSREEKMSKINQIIQRYIDALKEADQKTYYDELAAKMKQKYQDLSKEMEKTIIHKIGINGASLSYKASGEVVGSVLNQFSMDENGSYFRIATTKNRTWSRFSDIPTESYSNVFVLDENLKTVGALEKLASGEQIYAARFMGDRVYLVTFKQVDPFFVISLKNPTKPEVLGELKIPGFSNYLHPYDENTVIGFGKDALEDSSGRPELKGLKVALFDVSDVKNPKALDTYLMGDMGSESIALSDHKAFLFSKDKNLLVLPVVLRRGYQYNWDQIEFSGAMVFSIDNKKFVLRGKIDHSDGGQPSDSDYFMGYSYYDNTVKRSLYINNELYTLSNNYLKINNLNNLEEVKKLDLKGTKNRDYEIIPL